jgi:hypothetical protein
LSGIQRFKESEGKDGDIVQLETDSRRAIEAVIRWCVAKFGMESVLDASNAWVRPYDEIKIEEAQVSGAVPHHP